MEITSQALTEVHGGLYIKVSIVIALGSSSDIPKRSRKRQRKPETLKRTLTKRKRAKDEEYVSSVTEKTVLARKTGPDCKCKRRCFDKISENERVTILDSFYRLADKDLQDAHLFGLIQSSPVKRRRPRGSSSKPITRRASYSYFVSAECVLCVGFTTQTNSHYFMEYLGSCCWKN